MIRNKLFFSISIFCNKNLQMFYLRSNEINRSCVSPLFNGIDFSLLCILFWAKKKRKIRLKRGSSPQKHLLPLMPRKYLKQVSIINSRNQRRIERSWNTRATRAVKSFHSSINKIISNKIRAINSNYTIDYNE